MKQEIYLDNNATTRPLAEVLEAMRRVLGDAFGNPSSAHTAGTRARNDLRRARQQVAQLVGGESERVVFTGSGTEANNFVLFSAFDRAGTSRPRIVTTSAEHSSVLKMVEYLERRGAEAVTVPVAKNGLVELEAIGLIS